MLNKTKFNILVVDDERTNLEILNKILSDEYVVSVAKSGQSALAMAEKEQPDLILLDIVLPDMLGFDVLVKLKSNELTHKIPVIFVTGLSSVEGEERGFALGAVDYITKPFNNLLVKARVRNHLQLLTQLRFIEHLGMIDSITNLPNRRNFDERLKMEWNRAIREAAPISLLFMDVDHFKNFNDAYGHPRGDRLLQQLSTIFSASAKRVTDFTARIGGEEFVILLPNTKIEDAISIAEKIRQNVASIRFDEPEMASTVVTISIGITSCSPVKNSNPQSALEKADRLLYQAKREGRNRICWDNET